MDWASSSFGIAHARASPYRMLYFSLSRVTKTIATKYTIKLLKCMLQAQKEQNFIH